MATSRKPKGGQGRKMKTRKTNRKIRDLGDRAAFPPRPGKPGTADHARMRHSTRINKNHEAYFDGYFGGGIRKKVKGSGAQRAAAQQGVFHGRRDDATGGKYVTADHYYKAQRAQRRKTKR